ncbi:MAG: hypothetical protein GQ574_14280 [Crocinitomix sp.]|nr:hypothetical protein [Crocinitomix sp.]
MIKLIRFTNILPLSLFVLAVFWKFWRHADIGLYTLGTALLVVNLIVNLFLAQSLKEKQKNGEIHVFYNRNTGPLYLRWAIIALGAGILYFMVFDSADAGGWFWLTFLATRGIEHFIKINNWDVIIEKNAVYEKSFWMKSILISEITNVHINNQAQLEITTEKGMTLFKLESGVSVNVRDKIEAMQAKKQSFYA